MVITVVHTRGFAQRGNLCSLCSKIQYSMLSNTTTRAKVQEPAVSGSRALINMPLFSLETSLSFLLLVCQIGWRQKEKQEMMPLLAVFCTLHCYPAWIEYRGSNSSPSGSCSIRLLCKEDVQVKLAVTHYKVPIKGVHITRSDKADLRPHPTSLLSFDFHHDCYVVVCPFTSICCGLIWVYLGI